MIEPYRPKHFSNLYHFLKTNKSADFYFTENNIRKFIFTELELKNWIKKLRDIYIEEERGDIIGIICVWASSGNNILRHFVKINAINEETALRLVTALLWNQSKDLYIKINKFSNFLKLFKDKGFIFRGDRGKELLLYRYYVKKPEIKYREENVSDNN